MSHAIQWGGVGLTIDHPDTLRPEDALLLEETQGGYRLTVCVIDVSNVVPKGGDADARALRQASREGRSFLLCEELKSESHYLLPQESREAIVCTMELDAACSVVAARVERGSCMSTHRYSYQEIESYLEDSSHPEHKLWSTYLYVAEQLFLYRETNRTFLEDAILYGDCPSAPRAFVMVRECMILTNAVIASLLHEAGVPLMFRNSGSGSASFAATALGHLQLDFSAYARFTSPARHYDALVNHRQLIAWLENRPLPYIPEDIEGIAKVLMYPTDVQFRGDQSVFSYNASVRERFPEKQVLWEKFLRGTTEDLLQLDTEAFSLFLKVLSQGRLVLVALRREVIRRRMRQNKLLPGDFGCIFFAATTNSYWHVLQYAAYLRVRTNADVIPLMSIFVEARKYGVNITMHHTCPDQGLHEVQVTISRHTGTFSSDMLIGSDSVALKQRACEEALGKMLTALAQLPAEKVTCPWWELNPPAALMRYCIRYSMPRPRFVVVSETDAQGCQVFNTACLVRIGAQEVRFCGSGPSKKKAEFFATLAACRYLASVQLLK